jgi:hypothetical protein
LKNLSIHSSKEKLDQLWQVIEKCQKDRVILTEVQFLLLVCHFTFFFVYKKKWESLQTNKSSRDITVSLQDPTFSILSSVIHGIYTL